MPVHTKHPLLLFIFFFLFPITVISQNSGSNILFEITEQDLSTDQNDLSVALSTQHRRDVMQSLPLSVNRDVLAQLRNRSINSFQMYNIDGNLITISIRRVIKQLNDDWSVTGYINDNPINSFALSYSDGKLLSSIRNITSHSFMEISYRSENDSHYLLEIDPHKTDRISCGFDHSLDSRRRSVSRGVPNQSFPQSTGTVVIDVMIVYTPAAEDTCVSI